MGILQIEHLKDGVGSLAVLALHDGVCDAHLLGGHVVFKHSLAMQTDPCVLRAGNGDLDIGVCQQIQQLQHTLETVEYKCWFYEAAKAAGTVDVPGAMTDADVPDQFRAIRQELRGQKMPNIER